MSEQVDAGRRSIHDMIRDPRPIGGGDGTGADPDAGGNEPGAGNNGGGNGSGNDNPDAGGGNGSGADRTFTQADVDKIVGAKVTAELKKLGDIDELKTKASEFDKLKQEQMSEVDKLKQQLESEQNEKKTLQERVDSLTLVHSVEQIATTKGFHDPGDAVRFLDLKALERNEDGTAKKDSAEKALDDLAKEKPYLAGKKVPSGDPDNGVRDAFDGSETDMNVILRRGRASARAS